MQRIKGMEPKRAGWLARYAYKLSEKRLGKVTEPIAVTAHHPMIFRAYAAFEYFLEKASLVDRKLKALASIKPATMVGCKFCIDIGSMIGAQNGVTEQQMNDILYYRESNAFSDVERTVIDYAAAMTKTPVEITDALFEDLRKHFNDAQIVELTAEIAFENYRARFNHALGIGSQGFVAAAQATDTVIAG